MAEESLLFHDNTQLEHRERKGSDRTEKRGDLKGGTEAEVREGGWKTGNFGDFVKRF
jgi:hypothetical protein